MAKIFGTDGIRGVPGESPLDEGTVRRLGALLAARSAGGRFLRGRDTRESGPWLAGALASGIAAGGGRAVLGGVLPTPAVSRLVPEGGFTGGIVVSASPTVPTVCMPASSSDSITLTIFGTRATGTNCDAPAECLATTGVSATDL